MPDITNAANRSRMMSGIRGRDTQPELSVRRALHKLGLRFRLHKKDLPGKPDLVFPRYNTIVFVHGCFWHQHGCSNSPLPKSRPEFWIPKLQKNGERDERAKAALIALGWRVAIVWECSIRQATKNNDDALYLRLALWIRDERGCSCVFV